MSCHVSDIHPSLIYCQTKKIEILSPLKFIRDFRLKAHSMKVGFAFSLFSAIGRRFPLKKLAFRRRSGSLLGAFAPVGSPRTRFSRRPAPINFVLKEITPFVYKLIIKENRNTLTPKMKRERISEINCNFSNEKTESWSHPEACLRLVYPSCFFL
jgi:hypothetical protein